MVYNTAAKRDFLIALAIFHSRYVSLFRLLSSYPTHLLDAPSTFEHLTVQQSITRLCGLLYAAYECFGALDESNHSQNDCDAENTHVDGLTAYDSLSWPEVHGELRRLTQDLLARAVAADTHKRAGDPRYRNWLTRLSLDCAETMRPLENFADMNSQQQT